MPKKKRKPPSRGKYEAEHPVISFRTDRATKSRIEELCTVLGCSYADLMKHAAGVAESLIERNVDSLASKKLGKLEEGLEWIDHLLCELLCTLRENNLTALCPRCDSKGKYNALYLAWGEEIDPSGKRGEVPTWKCPKCGWYWDTFGRIEPKSIKWDDPSAAKSSLKPKHPPKKKRR